MGAYTSERLSRAASRGPGDVRVAATTFYSCWRRAGQRWQQRWYHNHSLAEHCHVVIPGTQHTRNILACAAAPRGTKPFFVRAQTTSA